MMLQHKKGKILYKFLFKKLLNGSGLGTGFETYRCRNQINSTGSTAYKLWSDDRCRPILWYTVLHALCFALVSVRNVFQILWSRWRARWPGTRRTWTPSRGLQTRESPSMYSTTPPPPLSIFTGNYTQYGVERQRRLSLPLEGKKSFKLVWMESTHPCNSPGWWLVLVTLLCSLVWPKPVIKSSFNQPSVIKSPLRLPPRYFQRQKQIFLVEDWLHCR